MQMPSITNMFRPLPLHEKQSSVMIIEQEKDCSTSEKLSDKTKEEKIPVRVADVILQLEEEERDVIEEGFTGGMKVEPSPRPIDTMEVKMQMFTNKLKKKFDEYEKIIKEQAQVIEKLRKENEELKVVKARR